MKIGSSVLFVGLAACGATTASAPVSRVEAPAERETVPTVPTATPVEVDAPEDAERYIEDELVGRYLDEHGGRWAISYEEIDFVHDGREVTASWRWRGADGDTHTAYVGYGWDGVSVETEWTMQRLDDATLLVRELDLEQAMQTSGRVRRYHPMATLRRVGN